MPLISPSREKAFEMFPPHLHEQNEQRLMKIMLILLLLSLQNSSMLLVLCVI